jgi:hypothetical protein
MIGHQQKGRKQTATAKLAGARETTTLKKPKMADESGMKYNPELDRFSADNFIPEKQKQAEARLANSSLPPFK